MNGAQDAECRARVGEVRRIKCGRGVGIRADDAGCAGCAMLRILQFAREVVVPERRDDKEERVDRQAGECQAPKTATVRSNVHLHRYYTRPAEMQIPLHIIDRRAL